MIITEENIYEEAKKGNLDILNSDLVDKIIGKNGGTALHYLAWKGCLEILDHPSTDKVKNLGGWTPLLILATFGKVEVLNHTSVDKIESSNSGGWSPLHALAYAGVSEVLNHYSVDKIKDSKGFTPLHYLAIRKKVPRKWLKERYPWAKIGNNKITKELISKILDVPNAVRFIGTI